MGFDIETKVLSAVERLDSLPFSVSKTGNGSQHTCSIYINTHTHTYIHGHIFIFIYTGFPKPLSRVGLAVWFEGMALRHGSKSQWLQQLGNKCPSSFSLFLDVRMWENVFPSLGEFLWSDKTFRTYVVVIESTGCSLRLWSPWCCDPNQTNMPVVACICGLHRNCWTFLLHGSVGVQWG